MDRNLTRIGLINVLVLLVMGGTMAWIAVYAPSATAEVAVAFQAMGLLVAVVSWFQMRLEGLEEAERLEMEDLARSRKRSALFENSAADSFPARRSREQFERWMLPGFTVLLFALQAGVVWWLYQRYKMTSPSSAENAALGGSIFAGIAVVQLLLGLYATKLARYAKVRLLRPSGASLLMGSLVALIAAVTETLDYFGYPQWDQRVAWVLVGLLGLIALETLIALIFEAYRPRVHGKPTRLIYESRLVGLLGQPTGLFSTAAQALDYQFGFKVSETWFFQFMERAVGRLLLIQFGLMLLLTTVVVVEPGEQILLERFGNPVSGREVLEPGLHLKFPWPIDRAHRYATRAVQSFNIGFVPNEEEEDDKVLLWTRSHYAEEFNMLVASDEQLEQGGDEDQRIPVNFLTVSIPVQYLIRDVRQWAYEHESPGKLLEAIANREVVRYLASVDIERIMSSGRIEAAAELKRRISEQAEKEKLGVEILFIGLQDIHPPLGNREIQVAAAYEQVIGAEQDKESAILEAQGDAFEMLPTAQAEAIRTVNEARSDSVLKVAEAKGRAGQFVHQLAAREHAPEVYDTRTYLDIFTRAVAPTRKYVVLPETTREVVILNLEDKIRADLLDIPLEEARPTR